MKGERTARIELRAKVVASPRGGWAVSPSDIKAEVKAALDALKEGMERRGLRLASAWDLRVSGVDFDRVDPDRRRCSSCGGYPRVEGYRLCSKCMKDFLRVEDSREEPDDE